MAEKIYFHIDTNSAFLSWTAVDLLKKGEKLDIRTIPAVVAGDPKRRAGVILAKSLPTKKFNIQSGEPLYTALKKCPELKVYPPDFKVYMENSKKLCEIISKYSPDIMQFSIDEFFMEYVPLLGSYMDVANKIKDEVENTLGFTVNIGISTNMLLAKMASDFEKPNKIHTLFLNEIEEKMWPLPIEDLFMCGKKSSSKLRLMGIDTIGKLAKANVDALRYHFKSRADAFIASANGTYVFTVNTKEKNKCYSNCITTKMDLDNYEDINAVLLNVAEVVSRRLRRHDFKAKTISVDFRLNTFQTFSHSKTVHSPVSTTKEIYEIVIELFKESWNKVPIRLLGISLSNLESEEDLQTDIFNLEKVKQNDLDNAIDKITNSFNKNIKIGRASAIFSENNYEKE